MGKTWQNTGVESDQSQEQIRSDRWSKEQGQKGAFCLTDGHLSAEECQECRIGEKHKKYKGRVVLRGDTVNDDSGFYANIHRTRIISITNGGRKSHGYHIQTARIFRTSSWCSIRYKSGQNGRCINVIKNSEVRMSRYLDTSTTKHMAKIMVQCGRPSRSSWRNLYGHPLAGLFWERQSKKILWEHGWEKFLIESAYLYTVKNILVCVCGWHKIGWNETKHWSDVESTKQKLIWENQHLSSIMKTWDAPKDNAKHAKILLTITEPCSNREFQRVNREITIPSKSSYFFMVLWHGWSCKEMRGTLLWIS